MKCENCGLPDNQFSLCDRWDCPDLKAACCKIFGEPVPSDLVGVTLDGKPTAISRSLAVKILTTLEDIAPGGQYCGSGFGYRLTERK